jgi:hypothetical protein
MVRVVLAALALIVLFYPSERIAFVFCVPVLLALGYWLLRRRVVLDGDVTSTSPQPVLAGAQMVDTERGRMA